MVVYHRAVGSYTLARARWQVKGTHRVIMQTFADKNFLCTENVVIEASPALCPDVICWALHQSRPFLVSPGNSLLENDTGHDEL
jgi:hypothetical protein